MLRHAIMAMIVTCITGHYIMLGAVRLYLNNGPLDGICAAEDFVTDAASATCSNFWHAAPHCLPMRSGHWSSRGSLTGALEHHT